MKRGHKYGAKRVFYDGQWWDSQAEADRWAYLKAIEATGEITELQAKPKYKLHGPNGAKVGEFWPDVGYRIVGVGPFIEDVKGYQSSDSVPIKYFNMKRKLFEDEYGIPVLVIPKRKVKAIPAGGV